ncbi:hypothetical protein ACHAXH_008831 [Discostella pseudostelligera]
MMDIDEAGVEAQPQPSPTCHIAVVGSQRQRVAKVMALLDAEKYRACIVSQAQDSSTSSPVVINIEYLPCVATFDSYEDERGNTVRYLVKLECYEPGSPVGKSLAPFFDEVYSSGENNGDGDGEENLFPGITAFSIGCGIEIDEDVDKIRRFLETLSSSCAAQISQRSRADEDDPFGITIQCIKPNPEYASLAEENNAFRELSESDRKEAVANGFMGSGKMANFVYNIAQRVIRQRLTKETKGRGQPMIEDAHQTSSLQLPTFSQQLPEHETSIEAQAPATYTPKVNMTRYACRICRSVLFGIEDQEDPPHSQSLHDFRKKRQKVGHCIAGTCQNYFIAQPLPWMDGCSDVEGKLHCPKCKTKVGHYSWTGAQCSCGTWVTPAIMVPISKVDEMKPMAAVTAAAGPTFYHPPSHQGMTASTVLNDLSHTMDVADN